MYVQSTCQMITLSMRWIMWEKKIFGHYPERIHIKDTAVTLIIRVLVGAWGLWDAALRSDSSISGSAWCDVGGLIVSGVVQSLTVRSCRKDLPSCTAEHWPAGLMQSPRWTKFYNRLPFYHCSRLFRRLTTNGLVHCADLTICLIKLAFACHHISSLLTSLSALKAV